MSSSLPFSERIRRALATRAEDALAAARHAPLEVLLGLIMACVGCLVINHEDHDALEVFARAMLMFYPVMVGLFALSILARFTIISPLARGALSLSFIGLSAVYVVWRLDPDLYLTEMWRWLTLCLGITAGFALLPLILKKDDPGRLRAFFWQFNARLLNHIGLSLVFLGALTLGIFFAMLATQELLGVHINDKTFAYVALFLLVGLSPWQIITVIARLDLEVEPQPEAFKELGRIACTYLFLPLMSLYLVILYLYQGRVLLNGMEAPKNMMSPLVLAAAGMLLVGMLLADQFKELHDGEGGLFLNVVDRLPMVFLPLMPMSAWAVWIRIDQYGWTEFRYLRLMLIIALSVIFVIATAQYFRKQPQPLMAIIGTFGLLSIVSTFGPLSAQAVSERSQVARLRAYLKADGMLDAHAHIRPRIEKDTDQPGALDHEGVAALNYLIRNFGAEPLRTFVSYDQFRVFKSMELDGELHAHDVLTQLGVVERPAKPAYATINFENHTQSKHVPHAGATYEIYLYHTSYSGHQLTYEHPVLGEEDVQGRVVLEEDAVRLEFGPQQEPLHIARYNLGPLRDHLVAHMDNMSTRQHFVRETPEALRIFTIQEEGIAPISLSVHHVTLSHDASTQNWHISNLQGMVVQSPHQGAPQ